MRTVLATLALAMSGSLLTAAPAEAVPGTQLLGHRCRTYTAAVTNENTVAALKDVAGVPGGGASCEVDAWRISDGNIIVWHDSTWGRVADHATLPAGVKPTDNVTKATAAQVAQIRTKGGEPVPLLEQMIDASAANRVALVVEVRNSIPTSMVGYANSKGADVSYYKRPGADCGIAALERLHNVTPGPGAPIGLNLGGADPACKMTPAQMKAKGVSFITMNPGRINCDVTDDHHSFGVKVYAAIANLSNYKPALAGGADKILVGSPRAAQKWATPPQSAC